MGDIPRRTDQNWTNKARNDIINSIQVYVTGGRNQTFKRETRPEIIWEIQCEDKNSNVLCPTYFFKKTQKICA